MVISSLMVISYILSPITSNYWLLFHSWPCIVTRSYRDVGLDYGIIRGILTRGNFLRHRSVQPRDMNFWLMFTVELQPHLSNYIWNTMKDGNHICSAAIHYHATGLQVICRLLGVFLLLLKKDVYWFLVVQVHRSRFLSHGLPSISRKMLICSLVFPGRAS